MGEQKWCDVCRMFRQKVDGTPDVKRYTLRREVDQTRENGERPRRFQMSAGGIDLCGECWEKIAKPRMNPNKSRRVAAWGPR